MVTAENKRRYRTFCKIKLPRITKESILEGNNELVANFHVVARRLIQLDSTAMILPWNEDTEITPIKKGGTFPDTRDLMEFYVYRTFVAKGKEPWCRFLLAHDKKMEVINSDRTWFRKQGMYFGEDDIQVKNILRRDGY